MTSTQRHALARVLGVLTMCVGGFFLLEHPVRVVESHTVAGALLLAGAHGTRVLQGTYLLFLTPGHGYLVAELTPACSSLASLLAIGCVAVLAPTGSRRRKWLALVAALSIVAVGNILRMAATVGVGTIAGGRVLVLFHDWVGGIMTFFYVLFGYVLFLYLTLPANPQKALSP